MLRQQVGAIAQPPPQFGRRATQHARRAYQTTRGETTCVAVRDARATRGAFERTSDVSVPASVLGSACYWRAAWTRTTGKTAVAVAAVGHGIARARCSIDDDGCCDFRPSSRLRFVVRPPRRDPPARPLRSASWTRRAVRSPPISGSRTRRGRQRRARAPRRAAGTGEGPARRRCSRGRQPTRTPFPRSVVAHGKVTTPEHG